MYPGGDVHGREDVHAAEAHRVTPSTVKGEGNQATGFLLLIKH